MGSCVCLLLALGPLPVMGQDDVPPLSRTQFGLGYTGNAPKVLGGGAAYVLFPDFGGIGIYVDAKFDVSGPRKELGFQEGMTAEELLSALPAESEATFNTEESEWWSANVALMRPLTPSFIVYLGGGLTNRKRYQNYNIPNDPEGNPDGLGVGGLIWVEEPRREERNLNLMFGTFMRLSSRISTQFGWETEPGGVTIGVSLRMPSW